MFRAVVGGAVTATVLSLAAALPAQADSPKPAAPAPAATGKSQAVIVLLRDQLAGKPADRAHVASRRSAARSDQDAVLARLAGPAPTHVKKYTLGNAFAATVTAAQADALASDPAVAKVVADRKVKVDPASPPPAARPKAAPAPRADALPAVDPSACSTDKSKPLLEPEALQSMRVRSSDPSARTAAALGIDGSGVKVAFIADGINPKNAGFLRKNGTSSITDYKDFYGDGPNAVTSGAEAFGDASAISAQGNVVYDVSEYGNPASVSYPSGHCYIKVVGVAPGSNVVALKAGSELLPNSAIIQAIDYATTTAHVDVINESFGANAYPDSGTRDAIQLFNDSAVRAGVTVTASTGDAGITSTIGTPSTDPLVISAGASTDSRIYEQTNYALATKFGNGTWLDDNTSSLSSAGITQNGRTIDIEAPGEGDWAVCDDNGNFVGCTSFGNPAHPFSKIQSFGGTSQSAPFTAGVAALVIQAYRRTHGGASPTPAQVKQLITSTARDLGLPGDEQGSGIIDARAAVEAALTAPAAKPAKIPAAAGDNIALSANQRTVTGAPGSTVSTTVDVRNIGRHTQSVVASTRRYAQLDAGSQNLTLNTASDPTTPYPTTGAPWAYKTAKFTVPSGADELSSVVRWASGADYGGAGPVVRLTLIDPSGSYAGNTRPQGGTVPSNYGQVTIRRPKAGEWTAVLYTPKTGGFSGKVTLSNESFRALPVGTVKPVRSSLAPGASSRVKVTLPVPSTGGDQTYTVSLASSGGHRVAAPVVVRALVPTASGFGRFAGTITGGNGRAYSPAQTFSYGFDVPRGLKDLEVSTTLADDPGYLLTGYLIDPNEQVQSLNSNRTVDAAGKPVQTRAMRNTTAAPVAGRWRYVIVVQGPVPGTKLREPFTGAVGFNHFKATGFALPATLPRGKTATARVTVTNTGPAPMVVQTDARTGSPVQQVLGPQFAGSTISLPLDVENISDVPAYLVPPDTRNVSLSAASTVPAQVELSSPGGGIDVLGDLQSARDGDTVSTASVSESNGRVGTGIWFSYVQEIGPFSGPAPAGESTLTATAKTKRFDRAVTTSTGDPFLAAIEPDADSGTPLVIAPGGSAVITVQVTPTAAKGSTVSGVLHLVTPPMVEALYNTSGEVLANIPYTYKVG